MFVWLCLFDFLCLLYVWHWLKDVRVWSHKSSGQARVVLMFWQMHHLQGRSRDHCQNTDWTYLYNTVCIYIYYIIYILYIYIGQKLLVSILGLRVELPSSLKATGRTQCLLVTQSSALVIVRSNFAGNSDWSLHCKIFRKPLSGMMEDMPKVPIFGLHVVYSIQHTNESWFSFSECLGAFALVQQNEHCQLKSCPLSHMSSSVIKIWGLLWFARRSE